MMKRDVTVLLYILSAVCMVSAQTWTSASVTEQKGSVTTVLSGPGGNAAQVTSAVLLIGADTDVIGNCLNAIWAIPGLAGSRASVRVSADGYKLVVYPDSFTYNNMDFMPYLPSGLGFYYQTTLFYDITLKVDGNMPRVAGAYVSPDGLLKNMHGAVLVPQMFMYDSNLLHRIETLERALMAVSKKGMFAKPSAVSEEIILAVIGLHNQNPDITPAQAAVALKEQGIKADMKDINAVFLVLLGEAQ